MRRKRFRRAIGVVAGLLVLVLGLTGYAAYYHYAWPSESESVTFNSGDLSLRGLLLKPDGPGPYPAVVVLHGSGRADGDHAAIDYRVHANAFVRKGLAVLVYDKRGIGGSQGDFSTAVYDDFVDDAVAAVAYLRSRDDIDPQRIGLFGMSEGGWLTPEVAVTAGDVAFIVNKCGAPLPWKETVLFEIKNELVAEGLDEEFLPEVLQMRSRIWDYYIAAAADPALATGAQRDAINAELKAIAERTGDSPSSGLPGTLREYDAELYSRLAAEVSYDPTPFLDDLPMPTLWIYGEDDVNVPTTRSVAVLTELKADTNRDITIQVFPGVGHSLMSWKGAASAGYVSGYLDLIGDWARDHSAAR